MPKVVDARAYHSCWYTKWAENAWNLAFPCGVEEVKKASACLTYPISSTSFNDSSFNFQVEVFFCCMVEEKKLHPPAKKIKINR